MKTRHPVRSVLGILLAALLVWPVPVAADTLSITAWSTGDALNQTNLNAKQTQITDWANGNIDNTNLKAASGIVGSKLDLTSGTGRISHSTSVTSDAPVLTSAQTWNNAANVFSLWRGTVTNTNSASTSRLIDLRVGSTIIASISRVGQFILNAQDYASGPTTLLEGAWLNVASATYTDNMTPASGTAPHFMAFAFQRPAVAAANSSVTTTHAATVYIASAPVTSTNMTLTNRYALWVDQGDVRIGGNVFASGTTTIMGDLAIPGGITGSVVLEGVGPHAIGGTVDPNSQLVMKGTKASTSSDNRALDINTELTATANFSAEGINVRPDFVLPASGNVADLDGIHVSLDTWTTSGATVTDIMGLRIREISGVPANMATNITGVYIENPATSTGATIRTLWSLGATSLAQFDGFIGMNTSVTGGAGAGDIILANNTGEIRGVVVAGNTTYAMLLFNSSNQTSIGANSVQLVIRDPLTQTTIGANGAASALTANPLGYLRLIVGATSVVIPYYNE